MKLKAVVLAAVVATLLCAGRAPAATDNKYYSEYALKHKLNDKFDLFFTPEFRSSNDMGNLYYYHWRAGSTYHAHKNLDLALAYRYIQTQDSKGEWDNADTQYIEMMIIPKIKLKGFNLSDANRFERRFHKNARDRWVYRNYSTLAYPAKIGGFEFTPYISDEVYYDFEIDKVNLNWAIIGVNKKVAKNLTVGIYYKDETSRVGVSNKWITAHVLGTNVTIDF